MSYDLEVVSIRAGEDDDGIAVEQEVLLAQVPNRERLVPVLPDLDLAVVPGAAVTGLEDLDLGLVVAEEVDMVVAFVDVVRGDMKERDLVTGASGVEPDGEIRAAPREYGRGGLDIVEVIFGVVRDLQGADAEVRIAEVADRQRLFDRLADGDRQVSLAARGDVDRIVLDVDLGKRRQGGEPEAPVVVEIFADDRAGGVLSILEAILRVPEVDIPLDG